MESRSRTHRSASGRARAAIVRLPLLVSFDPDDHVVREIRASAARGETTQWFTDETRQPALAHEVAAAVWRIADLDRRRSGRNVAPCGRRTTDPLRDRPASGRSTRPRTATSSKRARTPEGAVRPRDIVFTDARARAEVDWQPVAGAPLTHRRFRVPALSRVQRRAR